MNVSFDQVNTSYGSYQLLQKIFGGGKKAYLTEHNQEETIARLAQPKDLKHDYYRRQCIKAVTEKMHQGNKYRKSTTVASKSRK